MPLPCLPSCASAGLKVVVYPEAAKLQKQLKYADRIGVRYVLIAGPDERAAGQVTLKDLQERTQETLERSEGRRVLCQKLAQARGCVIKYRPDGR